MPVLMKAIKPSRLKDDVFRLEALNQMRKTGRAIQRDYKRTTQTWEGAKPNFGLLISLAGDGPTILVEAQGGKGADKWNWLDKGTAVRYATMSSNWRSKTTPNTLRSVRGRGVMLFVSKKHPRPGIKARNWTVIIVRMWTPRFKRDMEDALRRAVRKSGHRIT